MNNLNRDVLLRGSQVTFVTRQIRMLLFSHIFKSKEPPKKPKGALTETVQFQHIH